MGNYIFTSDALIDALRATPRTSDSRHDMGGNIIPPSSTRRGSGLRLHPEPVPGSTGREQAYWRDVGTIDAYHEAHMDLVSVDPVFNLYNDDWPIWTSPVQMPARSSPSAELAAGLDRQPGHASSPVAPIERFGAVTATSGCTSGPRSSDSVIFANAVQSARERSSAGRSWTRTSSSRRMRGLGWTPRTTRRAASQSPTAGSQWSERASRSAPS